MVYYSNKKRLYPFKKTKGTTKGGYNLQHLENQQPTIKGCKVVPLFTNNNIYIVVRGIGRGVGMLWF